jgi:hypothetical protein
MMNNPKLLAASFFVAGALALVAALLRYLNGEVRLSLVAAALFLIAMGIRQVRHRAVRA